MPSKSPELEKVPTRGGLSLKELAAHVGLSQATVSRVINQSATTHRIAAGTQKRVLEAAATLNYQPNVFARGLRNKRSFTVGVIVPEISEGYATAVLGGIEDVLLLAGFFYFVVSHRHRAELLREYPRLLVSRAVEGIIAVDSALEEEIPVPVVAVSNHTRRRSIVNIELDHLLAARYALDHLQRLGHRQIAFIKGQTFSSDTRLRWKAIQQVAADLGITIDPRLTVQLSGTGLGAEPGRAATVELLERGVAFTAIFAFNDLSAIGAITALHEAGIHVPAQISVVGFDDIPGAATNNPALTTVRQPLHEMGRTAATTLLQLIQGEDSDKPRAPIRILPTFVERQSTGPIPKAKA
ncbi:LacI family DNA-binding transcriptional regulator [Granulicella arctica]|uniref:LacI family DNA-binding transcriptional regulator n=1 Tax=Granulicella arctica TaxID=940613 RepID=UPI0021E0472E|nr:LacI family DNA-binding transcriptional regulator [Granulicella arctica]